MSIVLHINITDEQLKEAVREAIKGEIVGMTRTAIEEVIKQTVKEKLAIEPNSGVWDRLVRSAVNDLVKTEVKDFMKSTTYFDREKGLFNSGFENILRQEIREIISDRLRNTVIG